MTIVTTGILDQINPSLFIDINLSDAMTKVNDNFETIRKKGLGSDDVFCSITKVSNSNNSKQIIRSSKQNVITFILSTINLNCILPLPADIKAGDSFRFLIESGNPATFSATINLNGNAVNGSTSPIVIIIDRVTELVCLSTGFLKGYKHDLI